MNGYRSNRFANHNFYLKMLTTYLFIFEIIVRLNLVKCGRMWTIAIGCTIITKINFIHTADLISLINFNKKLKINLLETIGKGKKN